MSQPPDDPLYKNDNVSWPPAWPSPGQNYPQQGPVGAPGSTPQPQQAFAPDSPRRFADRQGDVPASPQPLQQPSSGPVPYGQRPQGPAPYGQPTQPRATGPGSYGQPPQRPMGPSQPMSGAGAYGQPPQQPFGQPASGAGYGAAQQHAAGGVGGYGGRAPFAAAGGPMSRAGEQVEDEADTAADPPSAPSGPVPYNQPPQRPMGPSQPMSGAGAYGQPPFGGSRGPTYGDQAETTARSAGPVSGAGAYGQPPFGGSRGPTYGDQAEITARSAGPVSGAGAYGQPPFSGSSEPTAYAGQVEATVKSAGPASGPALFAHQQPAGSSPAYGQPAGGPGTYGNRPQSFEAAGGPALYAGQAASNPSDATVAAPGPFGIPAPVGNQPSSFETSRAAADATEIMARSELPPQAPYGSSQAWPDLTRTDNGSSKKLSKGLLIATIILLVVLVAGGAAGYLVLRSKGGQTSQARITATPVLHATATKAPTPSPTPTQNGATTGTVGNEGQPIAAGNEWIATLTHVDETSNSFIPPASGQTYLEISLSLKNTEATSQLVSSLLQFSLTDASGKSYSETKGVGDTNIKDLLDGSVGAGQTLKGQIPYQVPLSVHDFTLTFKYDLIDGSSASISWNIHV